jgi:small-conductance mechanosensitive channel
LSRSRSVRFPRILILFAALVLGAGGALATPAPAGTPAPAPGRAAPAPADEKPFPAKAVEWTKALEHVRAELGNPRLTDAEFEAVRSRIDAVLGEAQAAWYDAKTEADATGKLLAALGAGPKEGEPPETDDVAKQRKVLKAQQAAAESRMKQADLIVAQASEIRGTFISTSGERLAGELLRQGPSPLRPAVWAKAVPEFVTIFAGLVAVPLQWLASGSYVERGVYSLAILLAGLILAALIGWPLRRWLLRRFGRDPAAMQPSMLRRLLGAAVEGAAGGLLPSLAVAAVYVTFLSLELFSAHLAPIASGICLGLVFFILVSSLTRAALSPDLPRWQLAPLDPENAKTISRMVTALAGLAAVIIFLHESLNEAQLSVEFKTAFNFASNSMIAAGMLFLLRRRLWQFRAMGGRPRQRQARRRNCPGMLKSGTGSAGAALS